MKKFLLLAAIALLGACRPQTSKVLVMYEDGGHHKPFTDAAVEWLRQIAPAYRWELTEIKTADPIDADFLKGFDVFLQLDYPPYMWPDEAKRAFESYIEDGKGGWIGLHHASLLGEFDGYPMWEWFSDFLGGIRFQDYIAELVDGTVSVEDTSHPVMTGVPEVFVIPDDEWYTYDANPRSSQDIHVLAVVNEDLYPETVSQRMGDHPVLWTNVGKKARNLYFQFGHSPKLIENEVFKKLMIHSVLWAAGRENEWPE